MAVNNKKEFSMTTVIVGKRHVPLEHIALLEPFDPSAQHRIQSERPFKTRIVLIDRDSFLSEEPLPELAVRHAFRMLDGDGIATNPDVHFRVEGFVPTEGFAPRKDYLSRLIWRDLDGEPQSKLLLSQPQHVLAVAVRGEEPKEPAETRPPPNPARRKRRRAEAPEPR